MPSPPFFMTVLRGAISAISEASSRTRGGSGMTAGNGCASSRSID